MSKCPTCDGRGFTELEHGLIMVGCTDCNGTGEVADPPADEGEEALNETLLQQGESHDSSIGTERDNQPVGSTDTCQPKKPTKQKSRKKARKGTS